MFIKVISTKCHKVYFPDPSKSNSEAVGLPVVVVVAAA